MSVTWCFTFILSYAFMPVTPVHCYALRWTMRGIFSLNRPSDKLIKTLQLYSPHFCLFTISSLFTPSVSQEFITFPVKIFILCMRLEKPPWHGGLLNRCPAWNIFLLSPHPKTMQHCAMAGDDRPVQAVTHIYGSQSGVKLHFGFSLDSDGWLTAEHPSVVVSRLDNNNCTFFF